MFRARKPRQVRNASGALGALAIVAVALNLRPSLAAIGPVLDRIAAASGLTSTGAGLLTTLPVFLMGLGALTVSPLRRHLGERCGVIGGTAMIALACVLRPFFPSIAGLLGSAAIAGLGIAVVQALMPGFIKRVFADDVGRVMGYYSTAIMGGATLAAASAAGLSRWFGWEIMLGLWALPALFALLLWRVSWFSDASPPESRFVAGEGAALRRSAQAWLLLLLFGVGTGAYTLILAWLPPFYVGIGVDEDMAGYLLAGLTLVEVAAGFLVATVIDRSPDRRWPLAATLSAILAGLACLVIAPLPLAVPAMILLGAGIGALFPLSLIVTLDHANDSARAGSLTAFVQGGGYLIASLTPFAAGWLRSHSVDLSQAWIAMGFGIALLLAVVPRFSPGQRIA